MRILSGRDKILLLTLSSTSIPAANSTSNASLPHTIFNDSSVAIVALGDGDKRLLFQEGSGSIREALFTQSGNSWRSDINNIVATDARNNTPLAAVLVNSTGTPFAEDTGPVVRISSVESETRRRNFSHFQQERRYELNEPQDLPLLYNRHEPTRQQTIHLWFMDQP